MQNIQHVEVCPMPGSLLCSVIQSAASYITNVTCGDVLAGGRTNVLFLVQALRKDMHSHSSLCLDALNE